MSDKEMVNEINLPPLPLVLLGDKALPPNWLTAKEAKDYAIAAVLEDRKSAAIIPYFHMYAELADAMEYDSGKDGLEWSPEEWAAELLRVYRATLNGKLSGLGVGWRYRIWDDEEQLNSSVWHYTGDIEEIRHLHDKSIVETLGVIEKSNE
jgi:hypothetical protein